MSAKSLTEAISTIRGKRCLVTGGSGFIGSHLVERLVLDGCEVRVIDNFCTGRRANLDHLSKRVEVIEDDICDSQALSRAVDGVEIIFHIAALPSVPRSMEDPLRSHEHNATGTLAVLEAARRHSVRRVIFSSSSSVYGDSPELPRVESQTPQPMSPYAASKLTGELYCSVFTRTFGVETVVLRYFNVFGPRQDAGSPYAAVIPKFIESARNGRSPVIFGDGSQTRDFTYVDNVVDANLLAAINPMASGHVFNVGSGEGLSVLTLMQLIGKTLNIEMQPQFAPSRPGDVRDSVASIEKAKQILQYIPRVNCMQGLEKMLARDSDRKRYRDCNSDR